MTSATQVERKTDEIVFTRIIDGPRDLLFKAWTEPKQLAQWWGPAGFTNPVCELYLRPGGAIRIDMRGADGAVYPMKGVLLRDRRVRAARLYRVGFG